MNQSIIQSYTCCFYDQSARRQRWFDHRSLDSLSSSYSEWFSNWSQSFDWFGLHCSVILSYVHLSWWVLVWSFLLFNSSFGFWGGSTLSLSLPHFDYSILRLWLMAMQFTPIMSIIHNVVIFFPSFLSSYLLLLIDSTRWFPAMLYVIWFDFLSRDWGESERDALRPWPREPAVRLGTTPSGEVYCYFVLC